MAAANKVALIGIDGLSSELLRYVATNLEFTYIKSLFDHSTIYQLEVGISPATASNWVTLTTGVNPGKHGVFGDCKRVPGTYQFVVPNARFRQAKPLWQIVEEFGYKVGVFNVPVSYPPEPVDGFIVAGSDMPGLASPFTYPNGLYLLLAETFGSYKPDVDYSITDKHTYLEDILKLSTHQFEVFEFLSNKFPNIDFVLAVFTGLDRLLHISDWKRFSAARPDAHPEPEEILARQVFYTFFQQLDQTLKKFIKDKGLTVILVATHGETAIRTEIDLNQWLLEIGFLSLNPFAENQSPVIDWQHTYAYCPGNYGHIYLNRKGREPGGIIEDGKEAKDILDRIRIMLCEKAKETQQPLILNILSADDLYWGPHVRSAPDLILKLAEGCRVVNTLLKPNSSSNLEGISSVIPPLFGHSKFGLFVANDHSSKVEKYAKPLRLHDMAPTLLSLMGIPTPEAMDGESIYTLSLETKNSSPREFDNNHSPVNIEELQQLVSDLEQTLQLKQAELKVQKHLIAPLQTETVNLQTEVARLKREVEQLRSGKVMRLLLWGGNLINRLKRRFN